MKFLHLSDLHIGKRINGFSMLDDQSFILNQILCIVRAEKPDAVIIAGDVYDKAIPGADAVRVFDRFLTGLAREKTAVLIVSGNHDSPERLDYASGIMSDSGVFVCGEYDGTTRSVVLYDEFGEAVFYLLPFIKPPIVRRFFTDEDIETYQDAVRKAVNALNIDTSKRNVLVAHQFFIKNGHDPELSDSEVTVGGIDSIDIQITAHFDYTALGHLHRAQTAGLEHARYSGSPLKYSASECGRDKSVYIVEMGAKGDVSITALPLVPARDMRKIKGPLSALTGADILSQGNNSDYLHVTLTDEDEIFDAIGKLKSVYPNIMSLTFENSRMSPSMYLDETDNADSEFEMFQIFFADRYGAEMKNRQAALVRSLLESEAVGK